MNNNKKNKHSKEKKLKNKIIIISICITVLLVSIGYLVYHFFTIWRSEKQRKELIEFIENMNSEENNTDIDSKNDTMLQKLKELKKKNSDLVGWLEIDDTNINYPVMQTDNNDYYINHNFKKQSDELGSIFLDMECSIKKPTANFLIYGHRSQRWSDVRNIN